MHSYVADERSASSVRDAFPVAGIVIPAHNEETVIGRCLDSLLADAEDGEFAVVVVANACSDRTAEIARAHGVTVVETDQPGKSNAICLGDRHLSAFPRIYLDADVELDAKGVRATVESLRRPGVLVAAPTARHVADGMTRWARRSHHVQEQLSAGYRSVSGKGAYALDEEGHERAFPIPPIISDDGWVNRTFTPAERDVVADAVTLVRPARTIGATLRRRMRVRQGNRQLDTWGKRSSEPPFRLRDLAALIRRRSVSVLDAASYLALLALDRGSTILRRGSVGAGGWNGDRTSRAGAGAVAGGGVGSAPRTKAPHVLIIVQNLPVPLDRRVWLECQSLRDAGYTVSVICPKGPSDPGYACHEGVHLYKYKPPPEATGALGYAWEFGYCWLRTAALSLRVQLRQRFNVIQACNPPDTYWLLARLWRPFGVRFVFDHHDLNPEVFRSRFGEPSSAAQRAQLGFLYWLERRTFASADHVISTNGSYRQIALSRGGVAAASATIVRSGPDTSVMKPSDPVPELLCGREHLVAYLGIMGPQDGVDGVLDVAERIVHVHGRKDIQFAMLGFGDCLEDLRQDCTRRELDEFVTFAGRVGLPEITAYLSTAAVGIGPDPMSPLNDVSTMNKTMEYMAYGVPVVTYSLKETKVSAGECAVYVEPGDVERLGDAVLELIDDPERRSRLGEIGRQRAVDELDWRPQARAYLEAYSCVTGWPGKDSA